jgi:hypothetical protein
MRELFTKQRFAIPSGHAVSGVARQEQTLRVLCGRVWITVEGVSHDYWLSAGNTYQVMPGRLTVVEADKPDQADIVVECSGTAWHALGATVSGLLQRLGRSTGQPAKGCA